MFKRLRIYRKKLAYKMILSLGVALFLSMFVWSWFSIMYREKAMIADAISRADKFCNTVLDFTWFAMLHNPNEDMRRVLNRIAEYNEVESLRLFDAEGRIRFSSVPEEVGKSLEKENVACITCHKSEPPKQLSNVEEKSRIFYSADGDKLLGLINLVPNKPGCSTSECHEGLAGKSKLGTLDVVVSLREVDREIAATRRMHAATSVYLLVVMALCICFVLIRFVTRPIGRLIHETDLIARDETSSTVPVDQEDEIGTLAKAISSMGWKISDKQKELGRQKNEYRNLFEQVPCYMSVQDRDFRLIQFNHDFFLHFSPRIGDYCYQVYKGRDEKCESCPVEKTFEDGKSHFSEERGVDKDGILKHWLVKTAPLFNDEGEVTSAMEMSIDISSMKELEENLRKSEQKYQAIFNNIPNPVFVLDVDKKIVLDCNDSVLTVYGYSREEIINCEFAIFFQDKKQVLLCPENGEDVTASRVRHITSLGKLLYVNIWGTLTEYPGQKVFLVTAVDVTRSVEAELQLIQAGKMATLGEMATGVAHELNQPLSVIKTASSFISKKVRKKEVIQEDILATLSEEIDSHVDRASKIITHMRLFGRKSDLSMVAVQVNEVLEKAFEIFSQQLMLREIFVEWTLDEDLPVIKSDPVRLEQVFINLLLNARDAIEKKSVESEDGFAKKIMIDTSLLNERVIISIGDTGTGIPEEIKEKIFEPFFTTKGVGEGTGLGLSISYGIIGECGGRIEASTNSMGGATFIINFPVDDVERTGRVV